MKDNLIGNRTITKDTKTNAEPRSLVPALYNSYVVMHRTFVINGKYYQQDLCTKSENFSEEMDLCNKLEKNYNETFILNRQKGERKKKEEK